MAGVPLFFGFVAKEQFYDSVRHFGQSGVWPGVVLVVAAVAASALLGAAGLMAGVAPFVGRATAPLDTPRGPAIPLARTAAARWCRTGRRARARARRRSSPLAAAAVTGDAAPSEPRALARLQRHPAAQCRDAGRIAESLHVHAGRSGATLAARARARSGCTHARCRRSTASAMRSARSAERFPPFVRADHRCDSRRACRHGARDGPGIACAESLDADTASRSGDRGADHRGRHLRRRSRDPTWPLCSRSVRSATALR